jgi:hypothetical protein
MPKLFDWVNAEILDRLRPVFWLSDVPKDDYRYKMPRAIWPIVDIENLGDPDIKQAVSKDISAAAGTYVPYWTVPAGKRWKLTAYDQEATVANTQVRIEDTDPNNIVLTALATAAQFANNIAINMLEGWSIGLITTGNGADSSVTMVIMVEEFPIN